MGLFLFYCSLYFTWFLGEFSSFSWATASSPGLDIVCIGQGKCPSIEGSSQQQLALRSTLACPVGESSCSVEVLEGPAVVVSLLQRRVVVGKVVPVAVQVVGHHVDEVQVFGDLGNGVAFVNTELGRGDGCGEEPALVHDLESRFQLGHQVCKVVLVCPFAVPVISFSILQL